MDDMIKIEIADIVYASVKLVTDIKRRLEQLTDPKTPTAPPTTNDTNCQFETHSIRENIQSDTRTAYGANLSTVAPGRPPAGPKPNRPSDHRQVLHQR